MTDQQLIIEVAKLDGRENAVKVCLELDGNLEFPRIQEINYLTSHDAIIPVIRKQSEAVKNAFSEALCERLGYYDDYYEGWNIHGSSIEEFVTATPKQLAIALVKACGKWEE